MLKELRSGSKVLCRDEGVREVLYIGIDDTFGIRKDSMYRDSLIYRVRYVGGAGYVWYFEDGTIEVRENNDIDIVRLEV